MTETKRLPFAPSEIRDSDLFRISGFELRISWPAADYGSITFLCADRSRSRYSDGAMPVIRLKSRLK